MGTGSGDSLTRPNVNHQNQLSTWDKSLGNSMKAAGSSLQFCGSVRHRATNSGPSPPGSPTLRHIPQTGYGSL